MEVLTVGRGGSTGKKLEGAPPSYYSKTLCVAHHRKLWTSSTGIIIFNKTILIQ